MEELLSLTDVFLPNQTEAHAIAHSENIEAAAQQLAQKAGLVAVKMGAAGALACRADSIIRAASIPVGIADSVGAGDAFDAGFVCGYLKHWSLQKTLRLACVCGALSMRRLGGTDGQPTLAEALSYVSG